MTIREFSHANEKLQPAIEKNYPRRQYCIALYDRTWPINSTQFITLRRLYLTSTKLRMPVHSTKRERHVHQQRAYAPCSQHVQSTYSHLADLPHSQTNVQRFHSADTTFPPFQTKPYSKHYYIHACTDCLLERCSYRHTNKSHRHAKPSERDSNVSRSPWLVP